MVAKKIDTFGGMVPAIGDRLLPEQAAARAENTWVYSGDIVGINTPKLVKTLSLSTTKIYRIPNNYLDAQHLSDAVFMEFTDPDTDVLRSAVVGDTFDRYYFASPTTVPQYNTKARIVGSDSFTKSLLHFEGPHGSQTIIDTGKFTVPHSWVAVGGAALAAQGGLPFGTSALQLNGSAQYVQCADNADWTLGTQDFTIEIRFNCSVPTGVIKIMMAQADTPLTPAGTAWYLVRNSDDKFYFSVSNGSAFTSCGAGAATYTNVSNPGWHTMEVAKIGNTLQMRIDGAAYGPPTTLPGGYSVNDSSRPLCIGSIFGDLACWIGSLKEFRMSVGIARHTSNYAPETAPYLDGGPPFLLGIPAPTIAPVVSAVGGSSSTTRTTAYVYTWVSAFGEEGPPSPATVITGKVDATWNLTVSPAAALDLGTNRNLTKTRIYRTVTSASGVASFFLVTELPIATLTFADTLLDGVVSQNALLQSTTWSAPPSDLKGMVAMPNGMIAGFRANEIWFCEPYRPHAWPAQYTLVVDFPIVGLGATGQMLVVATQSYPVSITGIHPATMSQSKLANLEPCTSRASIVSTPEGVYYTSANGLVLVTQGGVTNITQKLATKEAWQKVATVPALATFRGARVGSAYYGWGSVRPGVFDPPSFLNSAFTQADFTGAYTGILVDPSNDRVAFTALSNTVPAVNIQNDPWSGELFVIRIVNGVCGLYWVDIADANPTYETFKWRSKIFQVTKVDNLSVAKVFFEVPPTAPALNPVPNASLNQTLAADQWGLLRCYADGVLRMTREIRTSGELIRLPSGFRANFWQFEFEARVRILSLQFATSAKELATV